LREQLERALFAAQRHKIVCFEAWKLYLDDPENPNAELAWRRYMTAALKCNRLMRQAYRSGLFDEDDALIVRVPIGATSRA
jgi:hypothetical protein